jgi:hypothetical protein
VPREIPGLDREGFATPPSIRSTASRLPLNEFVILYKLPALHLTSIDPDDIEEEPESELDPQTARERSFKRTGEHTGDAERYDDRITFLAKRPGNGLPDMVSLGRALNNDIALDLNAVSKIHGYFLRKGDAWFYSDHQSTNGTKVNGKKVQKGLGVPLTDGDKIVFGGALEAIFRSPSGLYSWARGR